MAHFVNDIRLDELVERLKVMDLLVEKFYLYSYSDPRPFRVTEIRTWPNHTYFYGNPDDGDTSVRHELKFNMLDKLSSHELFLSEQDKLGFIVNKAHEEAERLRARVKVLDNEICMTEVRLEILESKVKKEFNPKTFADLLGHTGQLYYADFYVHMVSKIKFDGVVQRANNLIQAEFGYNSANPLVTLAERQYYYRFEDAFNAVADNINKKKEEALAQYNHRIAELDKVNERLHNALAKGTIQ